MKQIKQIVENIREELHLAEHYAKLATQYKDSNRQLADTYAKLSGFKLDHVTALHTQAVRMIKEETEPAPAAMQAVWDWEHDKMMDTVSRICVMLDMYRQS